MDSLIQAFFFSLHLQMIVFDFCCPVISESVSVTLQD